MKKVSKNDEVNKSIRIPKNELKISNNWTLDQAIGLWVKTSGTGKSELEVRDVTEKTAGEFKLVADDAAKYGWIIPGKLVHAYVKYLQPNGVGTRPDPYEILAAHPDVPFQSSHLRNLAEAYRLWEALGGEGSAPLLGISYFALALNSRLSFFEKEDFLHKAYDGKWSVRQLKDEIKTFLRKDSTDLDEESTANSPNVWTSLDRPLKKINAVISDLRLHRPDGIMPGETAEALKALAIAIDGLLKGYIDKKEKAA